MARPVEFEEVLFDLVARLPKGRPEPCEAVAGDREYFIHWWFELELPVSAVGLQPKEPDAGDVDGVFAVDPDESEGLEQRRHLADRSAATRGVRERRRTSVSPPLARRWYTSSGSSTRCSLREM